MLSSKELFNLFESVITKNCNDSYQFILDYRDDEITIDLNLSEDDYFLLKKRIGEKIEKPITINVNMY